MVKYYCDRCESELDLDDFVGIKPGVTENAQRIDLCLLCAVELDDIIHGFVMGNVQKTTNCCDCEYAEKARDEHPCCKCSKEYLDYFKRREN